jgi:hypothetical protein
MPLTRRCPGTPALPRSAESDCVAASAGQGNNLKLHSVARCPVETEQAPPLSCLLGLYRSTRPVTASMPCPPGRAHRSVRTLGKCPSSSMFVDQLSGSQSLSWSLSHKDAADLLVAKAPPAWPVVVRQRLARCTRCIASHRRSRWGHTGGTRPHRCFSSRRPRRLRRGPGRCCTRALAV